MDNAEKELTVEELAHMIQEQEKDFIIRVGLGEEEKHGEGGSVSA